MKTRAFLPLTLALLALVAPHPAAYAQDKDMAALEHYTLTMDKITRFTQVAKDLGAFAKAHPEAKKSMENDADQHESLDAMTNRISSMPEVVAIMNKDGLPPREFVLVEMTYMQAAMAFSMKPANEPDAKYCAEVHMNPANLTFMRDHQAELKSIQEAMGSGS